VVSASPAYPDALSQVSATIISAVGLPAERSEFCDAAIERLFGDEYGLSYCEVSERYFPKKLRA